MKQYVYTEFVPWVNNFEIKFLKVSTSKYTAIEEAVLSGMWRWGALGASCPPMLSTLQKAGRKSAMLQ